MSIKNIPFTLSDDFLETSQSLNPLIVEIDKQPLIQDLNHKFCSLGSCFAQNLKTFMSPFRFKFYFERQVCAQYHSIGMEDLLKRLDNGDGYSDDLIYKFSEQDHMAYQYFRLRYYGENSKERVRDEMKRLDKECLNNIAECDTLITTFGTTVYRKRNNGKLMNCFYGMSMKNTQPFAQLSVDEIVESLHSIHANVLNIRKNKPFNWILTISHQRYSWSKDITGLDKFQQNQLCKSRYNVAINEFVRKTKHEVSKVIYFPSYEIVIDELRLYETMSTYDHLHINQDLTPRYVVKKFLLSYATPELISALPLIEDFDHLIAFTRNRLQAGAEFTSDLIHPAWDMYEDKLSKTQNIEKIRTELIQLKEKFSTQI